MDLIKKTLILTDGSANGYLSVIKVGDDVGIKIVGEKYLAGTFAGVKIGKNEPIFFTLDGQKTEKTLNIDFCQSDALSCIIADKEKLIARGGNALRLKQIVDHFSNTDNSPSPPSQKSENDEKEELLEKLKSTDGAEYYGNIKDNLEELFIVHPREDALCKFFPDSEWVKINYDETDYYVVGKIKEQGRTVLIGYGVPGKKDVAPPKVADSLFTWIPVKTDLYDGYWVLLQDANSGKIIK